MAAWQENDLMRWVLAVLIALIPPSLYVCGFVFVDYLRWQVISPVNTLDMFVPVMVARIIHQVLPISILVLVVYSALTRYLGPRQGEDDACRNSPASERSEVTFSWRADLMLWPVRMLLSLIPPVLYMLSRTVPLFREWQATEGQYHPEITLWTAISKEMVNHVLPISFLALATYCLVMFWTRRRRSWDAETRCRKCGYILRGISEPRCPECGERI